MYIHTRVVLCITCTEPVDLKRADSSEWYRRIFSNAFRCEFEALLKALRLQEQPFRGADGSESSHFEARDAPKQRFRGPSVADPTHWGGVGNLQPRIIYMMSGSTPHMGWVGKGPCGVVGCRPSPPPIWDGSAKTKENQGKPWKTIENKRKPMENQWKTKEHHFHRGGRGRCPDPSTKENHWKTIGKPLENQANNLETKQKQQITMETIGKPSKTSKYQAKPMENQGKPLPQGGGGGAAPTHPIWGGGTWQSRTHPI